MIVLLKASFRKLNMQHENFKGELINKIIKEKIKKNNYEERKSQEKKGFPPCGICERTNHPEKNCWYRGKIKCQNCKKFRHIEKNCRFRENH